MKNKTYLAHRRGDVFGIKGDIDEALAHPNCPELRKSEFLRCTPGYYNETVIDLRFEGGEWQQ